jgi:hypothetical protein
MKEKQNTNTNTEPAILPMKCYGQFIKPLIWDNCPKVIHVYKCVSVSYVELPVQGNWKSHIAICNEEYHGFTATLWLMNGGYDITNNFYCRTIEEAKTRAEEWWVNFVSGFLNCP